MEITYVKSMITADGSVKQLLVCVKTLTFVFLFTFIKILLLFGTRLLQLFAFLCLNQFVDMGLFELQLIVKFSAFLVEDIKDIGVDSAEGVFFGKFVKVNHHVCCLSESSEVID